MAASAFTDQSQQQMLALARGAIARQWGGSTGRDSNGLDSLATKASDLDQTGACFVTLKKDGALRGCIGTLEAYRDLRTDIVANAQAAAFSDPRFPPVSQKELADLTIEISILSTPEDLPPMTEAQLLAQLTPGQDGLILTEGRHRATFLPSVWHALPDPQQFLNELKRKAGLPANHWSDDMRFQHYRCQCINEAYDQQQH